MSFRQEREKEGYSINVVEEPDLSDEERDEELEPSPISNKMSSFQENPDLVAALEAAMSKLKSTSLQHHNNDTSSYDTPYYYSSPPSEKEEVKEEEEGIVVDPLYDENEDDENEKWCSDNNIISSDPNIIAVDCPGCFTTITCTSESSSIKLCPNCSCNNKE